MNAVPDFFCQRSAIKVYARTLSGRDIAVICHPYDKIEDLRMKVAARGDCSIDQILLLLNGRLLDDMDTLAQWRISHGSVVFMSWRLRGG